MGPGGVEPRVSSAQQSDRSPKAEALTEVSLPPSPECTLQVFRSPNHPITRDHPILTSAASVPFAGYTYGLASRTERQAGVNRGATLGLRFDKKRSIQQFQPLLHADETQPAALLCCFAVKARSGIPDRELNLIRRPPQSHFEVPCPAVFCRIANCFLQDPEQAQGKIRRQQAWQILGREVNFHLLLLAELLAKASHGRGYAQIFQLRRVQLVRQGLDVLRYLGDLVHLFVHAAADFSGQIGSLLQLL